MQRNGRKKNGTLNNKAHGSGWLRIVDKSRGILINQDTGHETRAQTGFDGQRKHLLKSV